MIVCHHTAVLHQRETGHRTLHTAYLIAAGSRDATLITGEPLHRRQERRLLLGQARGEGARAQLLRTQEGRVGRVVCPRTTLITFRQSDKRQLYKSQHDCVVSRTDAVDYNDYMLTKVSVSAEVARANVCNNANRYGRKHKLTDPSSQLQDR